MIGLIGTVGFLFGAANTFLNMSETMNPGTDPTLTQQNLERRQQLEQQQQSTSLFIAGAALSFIFFIALSPITFVVKTKRKMVGVILIVFGAIAMFITNFWGVIPFALLLPAGILAIRSDKKSKEKYYSEE